MIIIRPLLNSLLLVLTLISATANAELEIIKTETFDGEKFIFPTDIKGSPLSLLFLAMGKDRDNGQLQQQQLIEWHKALQERGILNEQISAYHFAVMESPPFFVKGIIRSAMADAYEGTAATNQSGVLYIDDLEQFANKGKLILDEKPTLVLLSVDGEKLQEFKGTVSDEMISAVQSAIDAALSTQQPTGAKP